MYDETKGLDGLSMAEVSRMIERAVQRAETDLFPDIEPELPLWDARVHVDAATNVAWKFVQGHRVVVDLMDADLLTQRLSVMVRQFPDRARVEQVQANSTNLGRRVLERVLGRQIKDGYAVDHLQHDPLDNRRDMLAEVTTRDNNRNRRPFGKSKFLMVHWRPDRNKWQGRVTKWLAKKHGLSGHVGYFDKEADAARAVDAELTRLDPTHRTNQSLGLLPPLEVQETLPLEQPDVRTPEAGS